MYQNDYGHKTKASEKLKAPSEKLVNEDHLKELFKPFKLSLEELILRIIAANLKSFTEFKVDVPSSHSDRLNFIT